MTNKQIFWVVLTVIAVACLVGLKLTNFINAVLAFGCGVIGVVVGWLLHMLYDRLQPEEEDEIADEEK